MKKTQDSKEAKKFLNAIRQMPREMCETLEDDEDMSDKSDDVMHFCILNEDSLRSKVNPPN